MWERRSFLRTLCFAGAAALVPGNLSSILRAQTGERRYTVRPGDTLSQIARQQAVSVDELRVWNRLTSDRILVGQELIVGFASARIHVVQRGESLSVIATRYGTTIAAIRAANNITGDRILVGQELVIPSSASGPVRYQYIDQVVRATQAIRFNPSRWQHIVVHHSAIARGNAAIYDRNHREQRRWANGLAYHFVIGNGIDSGDGEVEIGGRWINQIQGGHVRRTDVNQSGIGICLVGNFEETRPSPRQLAALDELVVYLKQSATARNAEFTVHRLVDRNHTVCPGRNFPTVALRRKYN